MADKEIRLLVVEDSEDDAQIAVQMLCRGGFDVQHERVESAAALAAALRSRTWDAVLSDFHLPGFNGMGALRIVRAALPDMPFILMSGKTGEEIAVDAMRAGRRGCGSRAIFTTSANSTSPPRSSPSRGG